MRKITICGIAAFALMSLGASTAMAGAWTNPAGAAQDFSYTNGHDIHGRYGDPDVIGNIMSFPYVTFQANSPANGSPATDGDTVSWDMQCNDGYVLNYVNVWAFGSYTMTGIGSSVDADMSVAITEIQAPHRQWIDSLTSAPAFPVVSTVPSLYDSWYGLAEMDLSGELTQPGPLLHVDMTTLLQAMAAAGGGAEINTQYQEVRFEFVFVPEPATVALIAIAGLALIRRR